jgi:hypothetical protein
MARSRGERSRKQPGDSSNTKTAGATARLTSPFLFAPNRIAAASAAPAAIGPPPGRLANHRCNKPRKRSSSSNGAATTAVNTIKTQSRTDG